MSAIPTLAAHGVPAPAQLDYFLLGRGGAQSWFAYRGDQTRLSSIAVRGCEHASTRRRADSIALDEALALYLKALEAAVGMDLDQLSTGRDGSAMNQVLVTEALANPISASEDAPSEPAPADPAPPMAAMADMARTILHADPDLRWSEPLHLVVSHARQAPPQGFVDAASLGQPTLGLIALSTTDGSFRHVQDLALTAGISTSALERFALRWAHVIETRLALASPTQFSFVTRLSPPSAHQILAAQARLPEIRRSIERRAG